MTKEGLGVVVNDTIHQVISWSRPHEHTSELNYTIQYGPANHENSRSQSSAKTITSNEESVNLTFLMQSKPERVMYNIWVAAVSDTGQGEFSNKTVLTYDGKNQQFTFIVHTA